jgi:hypothetical protein
MVSKLLVLPVCPSWANSSITFIQNLVYFSVTNLRFETSSEFSNHQRGVDGFCFFLSLVHSSPMEVFASQTSLVRSVRFSGQETHIEIRLATVEMIVHHTKPILLSHVFLRFQFWISRRIFESWLSNHSSKGSHYVRELSNFKVNDCLVIVLFVDFVQTVI